MRNIESVITTEVEKEEKKKKKKDEEEEKGDKEPERNIIFMFV